MNSAITLWGFQQWDNSILDGVAFPEGTFDAEMERNCLNRRWGMAAPYIQAPGYLKAQIAAWFEENRENWIQLYKVYTADYNPIHNYSSRETETRTPDLLFDGTVSGSDTANTSGSGGSSRAEAAYNTTALKETLSDTSTTSGHTDSTTTRKDRRAETGTEKWLRERDGNIGVTTTMNMIRQELDERASMNPYEYIADMFAEEFLCLVF